MTSSRMVKHPRLSLLCQKPDFGTLADHARDAGQWKLASELYRKALDRNPRSAPLWVQYGHALKESGELRDPDRLAQAEIAYRRALSLDPGVADSYLQLGHIMKIQGNTEEAEASYLRAFALDPSMPYPIQELGDLGWSEAQLSELRAPVEPIGSYLSRLEHSNGSGGAIHQGSGVAETALAEASRRADLLLAALQAVPLSSAVEATLAEALRRADKLLTSPPPAHRGQSRIRPVGCGPEGCIGATARRQVQFPDLFELRALTPRGRIAVVLHLFDPDLWGEIRGAIERISHPFDLFVSLVKGSSEHMRALITHDFPRAWVFDFENRGRDIGPFLVFLQSGVLFQYDLICKLHTKRSPYLQNGDAWRHALIDGILGTSHLIDQIVSSFDSDPDLGMVVADGNIYIGHEHWASNENLLAELLPRIGISTDVKDRSFPGGSIFWVRAFLLRTLVGARLQLDDFEPEPLNTDGGLGHAVERMFGLICEDAGMRVVESSRLMEAIQQHSHSSSIVHLIAYYLPQFHPTAENDGWWGIGFTEWTNVTRAKPMFAGHRQPRLPSDLGFYDLRLPEAREAQAELARRYGLAAFCYYYYWFNGRRVLERPLNEVLASGKPDFPFLICWANEPWNRNWDGHGHDVLLPQTYEAGWVARFAHDVAPLLRDQRYFSLNGKPILLIYRVGHIPRAAAAMHELRTALSEEGIHNVHLAAGWVSFGEDAELPADPAIFGLDAYFEFPPHMLPLEPLRPGPSRLAEGFDGDIYDYNSTVTAALTKLNEPIEGRRHRCIMAGWDNTARVATRAHIWHGATPANFRRWLRGTILHEREHGGERVVFLNAWNEWAEGAYLEPDNDFGRGWLEAVASAVEFDSLKRQGPRYPLAAPAVESGDPVPDGPTPSSECPAVDVGSTGATARTAQIDDGEIRGECLDRAGASPQPVVEPANQADQSRDYANWIRLYDTIDDDDRRIIAKALGEMINPPLISVVMPVYETPDAYLRAAIVSVLQQLYPHWELCIADDASRSPHIREILEYYRAFDPRIKVHYRRENGHISAATNSALALAEGSFVALLDHDDALPEHALYVVAALLNADPEVDLIYSDEDRIDADGRRFYPYFKSDWNPDLMLSQNMFCHLGVYRRSLIEKIGGFRCGYEGSQDYDLVLRAQSQTTADRIRHIPHILYHWRAIPSSTALCPEAKDYAVGRARQAITDHLVERGIAAEVLASPHPAFNRVRYALPEPVPRVTIVISTRNRVDVLRTCIEGLLLRTDYPDLEILIVDHQSSERATRADLVRFVEDPRVRILSRDAPLNYSATNNFAVASATGSLLCLLNDSVEVVTGDWLKEMASHALRPGIGAVGALLYYPDGRILHGGIVLGIGGIAGYAHHGLNRGDFGYFGRAAVLQNLSAVATSCFVMTKTVFDQVKGFNEIDLPGAFNDIDLCLRIREAGYRIVWTPHAELCQRERALGGLDIDPDPDTVERVSAEAGYIRRRWNHILDRDPYYNPNLCLDGATFELAFPPRIDKLWRYRFSGGFRPFRGIGSRSVGLVADVPI